MLCVVGFLFHSTSSSWQGLLVLLASLAAPWAKAAIQDSRLTVAEPVALITTPQAAAAAAGRVAGAATPEAQAGAAAAAAAEARAGAELMKTLFTLRLGRQLRLSSCAQAAGALGDLV